MTNMNLLTREIRNGSSVDASGEDMSAVLGDDMKERGMNVTPRG
jgi:hypothetical protein